MKQKFLGGALLALGSLAVAAQQMPDEAVAAAEAPVSLDTVQVTGTAESPYLVEDSGSAAKLSLSPRETPQSLTVITRERLDDQHLTSLRQVLDNTPGIYSRAWDTERVIFSARGFDVDNLMYDGVPVEKSFGFSTNSIDDSIDTAAYERIEIVRGATGLMTGAGNPAASVNLVRKRADSKTLAGQLDMTASRWDDQRFEADVAAPLTGDGRVRGRLIGVYQDRASYQNLYRNRKEVFVGLVEADLAPGSVLSLGYELQDNLPRSNTWGSFPLFLADGSAANWPRSVTSSTDWSFWERNRRSAFAELRQDLPGAWSLRASLNWRDYEEDVALFYMYGFPDPQTGEGLAPFAYRSDGKVTEKVGDVYAVGPLNLFGREHQLVAGYSYSRADNVGNLYATPEDLPDPGNFFEWDGSYPQPAFATEGTLLNDIDTRQQAFYTAGRFVLADALKLIAGARVASWKTEYFYVYDSPEDGFRHDYRKTIPYAGLIYDLSGQFSAFASYTQIFEPQNARDVTGAYLDPMDGSSHEVGVKGEHFGGRLNTALTVFETRQDNVAEAEVDPETGEPVYVPGTGGLVQASRAVDGTRARGFEFEATGELMAGWNASLGWSRYLLKDSEGNEVRSFAPRNLLRVFSSWTPASLSKLTVGGGANWQSASSSLVGAPSGGVLLRQGSFTLVSALMRYQITPQVSIQANANNLLDKTYYVLDEYDNTYYGSPLNWSLSLNLRL